MGWYSDIAKDIARSTPCQYFEDELMYPKAQIESKEM